MHTRSIRRRRKIFDVDRVLVHKTPTLIQLTEHTEEEEEEEI